MKKLRKISLRNLGQAEMQRKMMGMLKGGIERCDCLDVKCGCLYDGTTSMHPIYGGTNGLENYNANGGNMGFDLSDHS